MVEIYINPSCSLAASVIMPWFHGGSQTSSTFASSIGSSEMQFVLHVLREHRPHAAAGRGQVIFTSALKLFSPTGVRWQS